MPVAAGTAPPIVHRFGRRNPAGSPSCGPDPTSATSRRRLPLWLRDRVRLRIDRRAHAASEVRVRQRTRGIRVAPALASCSHTVNARRPLVAPHQSENSTASARTRASPSRSVQGRMPGRHSALHRFRRSGSVQRWVPEWHTALHRSQRLRWVRMVRRWWRASPHWASRAQTRFIHMWRSYSTV